VSSGVKLNLHVQIHRFEGPLALLLHLIRKEEMDIFDINIHQITHQFLEYIKAMKQFDLELAGEFVAMAATLIHIKSKLLLPQYDEHGEEVESEDPRQELVQKLLEYQKHKEAGERLYERALVGRDVWLRGVRFSEMSATDTGEIIVEENPLFALISAYRFILRNMKKGIHRVGQDMQSISERILEMRQVLIPGGQVCFKDLVTAESPAEFHINQVLITFLSLLELAKMGFISLFQAPESPDIFIQTKIAIDRDVVLRVENYESIATAELVDSLFRTETPSAAAEMTWESEGEIEPPAAQASLNLEGVEEESPNYDVEAATDEEILAEEIRLKDGLEV
jgi:segregation and condensation protein A